MKSWGWKSILAGVFLVAGLFVVVGSAIWVGIRVEDNLSYDGPAKIEINLKDVELDTVRENGKDEKYLADDLKLTTRDGSWEFSDVELKGHGNATWVQEKKPFQIKLQQKADLLGLGKRRKWILLANMFDPTNLRTDTAFYIEKLLGERFAYRGEFVDLYLNDDYEGLYYLTRGVEIDKNAIDLKDSMGILVELDNAYAKGEPQYYVTNGGDYLVIKDAKTKDYANLAMVDFLADYNELEKAVKEKNFARIAELVDIESFARYYLLEEFIANTDAYFTSQYFYKDGPEDKIHAGPAWDFDIALNLSNSVVPTTNYTELPDAFDDLDAEDYYGNNSRLFSRLIEFPEFRAEVRKIFDERMSGHKQELSFYILRRAAQVKDMALRDSKKWNKHDFMEEVKRLLDWVRARYDYFEMEYGKKRYQNHPAYDINVIEV